MVKIKCKLKHVMAKECEWYEVMKPGDKLDLRMYDQIHGANSYWTEMICANVQSLPQYDMD